MQILSGIFSSFSKKVYLCKQIKIVRNEEVFHNGRSRHDGCYKPLCTDKTIG